MSSKVSPFPPSYAWIDVDDLEKTVTTWDDPTRLAMAQFFLQYDDAFRHQLRQCRQPWLVFLTLGQRNVHLVANTVSAEAANALLAGQKILPPISGERTNGPVAVLFRPGLEPVALHGIARNGFGGLFLHSQLTEYSLDEVLFRAWRVLKPHEVEILRTMAERIQRATTDASVLDAIARMLSGREWNSELFSRVQELVEAAGRTVAAPEEAFEVEG